MPPIGAGAGAAAETGAGLGAGIGIFIPGMSIPLWSMCCIGISDVADTGAGVGAGTGIVTGRDTTDRVTGLCAACSGLAGVLRTRFLATFLTGLRFAFAAAAGADMVMPGIFILE